MNRRLILPIILTLGLLITGCSESTVIQAGEPAPDFQLQNLDGQSVSLSDFNGKPVLLHFWASWCEPCRYEMPYMQAIYDDWSDQGLILLTVNRAESPDKIAEFMQNHSLDMPVLIDVELEVFSKYKLVGIPAVTGIPATFFIDSEGIIQDMVIGAFPNQAAIENRLGNIIQ